MLHTEEQTTCPIVDARGDWHFELRCEDCDIRRLSRATLGQVEDRYHVGRITQDQYEAYRHVWARLSPHGGQPARRDTPETPAVRRLVRKLLRARGFAVPAELLDEDMGAAA